LSTIARAAIASSLHDAQAWTGALTAPHDFQQQRMGQREAAAGTGCHQFDFLREVLGGQRLRVFQ